MKTDNSKSITDEKLLGLICKLTIELDGVIGMAQDAEGIKASILSRDIAIKDGVRLSYDKERKPKLDIFIRVRYGVKIPQLAWELQKKIQEDIKNQTGLLIEDINIHVEGVDLRENI